MPRVVKHEKLGTHKKAAYPSFKRGTQYQLFYLKATGAFYLLAGHLNASKV